jgi:hypothetical protein
LQGFPFAGGMHDYVGMAVATGDPVVTPLRHVPRRSGRTNPLQRG